MVLQIIAAYLHVVTSNCSTSTCCYK